jgi:hypothetical protein
MLLAVFRWAFSEAALVLMVSAMIPLLHIGKDDLNTGAAPMVCTDAISP